MSWIAAGVTAASAAYQIGSGINQKNKASNLQKSNYVPPQLLMNKDLAMQQAYSRRAPGAAFAEEQNRRLAANQIAGAQRMFGGDANKIAAVSAGATQQAQDANSRIAAQGQQFSENAFGRLSNANAQLAGNDRINQNQYIQTKAALNNAGNTNIYSGINNLASTALVGMSAKGNKGATAQIKAKYPTMDDSNPQQYNPNFNQPYFNQPYFNQKLRRGFGMQQWGGWRNNGWANQ